MNSLPSELISKILGYAPAEYARVRCVCVQFRALADDLIVPKIEPLALKYVREFNLIPEEYKPSDAIVRTVTPLLLRLTRLMTVRPLDDPTYDLIHRHKTPLYQLSERVGTLIVGVRQDINVKLSSTPIHVNRLYEMTIANRIVRDEIVCLLLRDIARIFGYVV